MDQLIAFLIPLYGILYTSMNTARWESLQQNNTVLPDARVLA
jgi:hypothetical protein